MHTCVVVNLSASGEAVREGQIAEVWAVVAPWRMRQWRPAVAPQGSTCCRALVESTERARGQTHRRRRDNSANSERRAQYNRAVDVADPEIWADCFTVRTLGWWTLPRRQLTPWPPTPTNLAGLAS